MELVEQPASNFVRGFSGPDQLKRDRSQNIELNPFRLLFEFNRRKGPDHTHLHVLMLIFRDRLNLAGTPDRQTDQCVGGGTIEQPGTPVFDRNVLKRDPRGVADMPVRMRQATDD